jgi:hypothetical protein
MTTLGEFFLKKKKKKSFVVPDLTNKHYNKLITDEMSQVEQDMGFLQGHENLYFG